jgi:diguanylate cyclase (GGDEF)-like protein
MFQLTAWSLPSALAIVVALVCAKQLRQMGPLPGLVPLRWTLVCAVVCAGGQLIESLVTPLPLKQAALTLQYAGVVSLPLTWLLFALTYARQQRRLSTAFVIAVALVPSCAFLTALTNPWHGLTWSATELVTVGGYVGVVVTRGSAYLIVAIYNYALVFAGLTVVAFVLTANGNHRRPLYAAVSGVALAALLHGLHLSPWSPTPWFDPTPLGLSFAALLLTHGLARSGLVDLVPIVRDRVFEHLADAAVIVNPNGRILDVNRSASVRLLPHGGNPLNQNIGAVLPAPAFDELINGRATHAELSLAQRGYHVTVTALDGPANASRLALVFRDITERRNAEQQLRLAQRELERMAHTDPLTGLYNRRYFMRRLNEEVSRFQRHGSPLSVLVFDLDLFKEVNDAHGHDAGDRALQAIAAVLNEVRRATDVPARMGGEEFALLLPETDCSGATRLAERLRGRIADQPIVDADGNTFNVTASVGVATITELANDAARLLRHADQALYRAKESGRNTVCLAA